jgi:nucleotide-binding universal stress UspA family protein
MRVLLAVDGSEPSRAAVEATAARVWPAGTTVRLLAVVEDVIPPPFGVGFEPVAGLEPIEEAVGKRAEEAARAAASALESRGLTAEVSVQRGDPRSRIVDEADEWRADLIVVGSHGYRGLQRWLLGSVAQAVAAHASCSVEIVRKRPARVE